jgi:hypothetical protein
LNLIVQYTPTMNTNKYFLLLLFLCILSIYYNVFLSIFRFDFIKIVDIEILKNNQHNVETNLSISNSYLVPSFIANLENNHNCKIDISNEFMILNIKKNIKSRKKNYYTIIDDDKKNICSTIDDIYEIIITYISFYISIICFSIITMSVIVDYLIINTTANYFNYYICYYRIYGNNNNNNNQNINKSDNVKIESNNIKQSNDKENILDDYICV